MSLDVGDTLWGAAIASGAPPFERLRSAAFQVAESDPAGAEAARRWLDTACGGSPDRERELLAVLGTHRSGVIRAFGQARLDTGQHLPAWVLCLIEMIQALPESPSGVILGGYPIEAGTEILFRATNELLDWKELRDRHPFLDAQILVSLTRQLATRIVLACGATLHLENTTRLEPVWDFSRTAWLDRLCGFTGLNFVVGTAIRQWRQNAIEILTRVGRDLPLLERTLLKGTSSSVLVDIEADLGDRHNDGRSVAVLLFADGRRVVYKPKDLRCASHFLGLLAFLNERAPAMTFPTRHVINRGNYAWEEYVEQRSAETRPEAARFFRRFGMLLRVLQLVEGRDFWLDNLRICGDAPVFIDLECILHPRLRRANSDEPVMGLTRQVYEESVLPTAAVTHVIDIPDVGTQDFGALSSPGPRVLPLGTWSGYGDQRHGNIWLQRGRLYWEPQLEWPRSSGIPADPVDYLDDLEGGYREAHQLLSGSAADLRGPYSPLTGISDVPVRTLMRSTWEYLVFLRASLQPMALLDGNARELALAHVIATSPKWTSDDDVAGGLAISCLELDALRNLDIPEFYSLPSDTRVMDTACSPVADVFEASAHARLVNRLTAIKSFDVDAHVRILRRAVGSIIRPAG